MKNINTKDTEFFSKINDPGFFQKINDSEFYSIINEIISNETVLQMNLFKQHYNTSCFEHCLNVSYYSYLICKNLKLDYKSAARSGMLHDLFLYDWRTKLEDRKGFHAFTHPKVALNNAKSHFELNEKEQDIILKHMWPVTIKLPKFKETYIITLIDKYCAIKESLDYYRSYKISKKFFRYAYIILNLVLITLID